MSLGVFLQRFEELRLTEVRPERRCDDKFSIGNLPEQKIAHAHLAARADQQVRVGNVPRPKMLRNDLLGDVGGLELPLLCLFSNAPDCIHDFNAAAVAQRHDERKTAVFGKGCDGFFEMFLHIFRQPMNLSDNFQPDVVFVQLRRFGFEIVDEIFHQRVHFVLGAIPVFRRERVKREILDAEFTGGTDDGAGGFGALPVAFDAWQTALLRPAAIAVHDDRNVLWQQRFGFGAQINL